MTTKRRLPVLPSAADVETPPRPPWQWTLLGSGLMIVCWLVLALATSPVSNVILRGQVGPWSSPEELARSIQSASPRALARIALANALLQAAILGVASFVSGIVVGTWGPRRGVAESASAGALVAGSAVLLTSVSGALSRAEASSVVVWGVVILVPLAAGAAALGARRGSRSKRVLEGP